MFIFRTTGICILGVPFNNLAPMKNCPGLQGAGVVESSVGYCWSMTDSGLKSKLMTQAAALKKLPELTMCQCQQLNLPLFHANM